MTGRHFDHVLLPFSFREFLSYNKIQYDISKGLSTAEKVRLLKGLEKYLYTGGFPIGIELGKQYLDDLYTDIIFKDVVIRHKIKLSSKMRDLADYLASSSSTEVSYNKLRNIIGLSSKHTIKEWIGFLEEAYLIFILKRFSFKKKETLKYPFKMYSIDPGFIASSLTSGSISKRMEEVVAIELLRRKNYLSQTNDIYYWKDSTNKEIDFLLEDSGNVKQLIQVTYASERDSINQREIDNLITGASKLNCNNLFVITWDYEANEAINGRRIRFIPLWKWLLKPY
jgi:predicted AAA+ superfamily ATPase